MRVRTQSSYQAEAIPANGRGWRAQSTSPGFSLCRFFRNLAVLTASVVLLGGIAIRAEEGAGNSDSAWMKFELSSWASLSGLLSTSTGTTTPRLEMPIEDTSVWPEWKWSSRELSRLVPRRQLVVEKSLLLMHQKLHSRYSYDAWANLQTGYGQYLSDDTLGRSRTNGAGLVETDWFYLKMSFKF